MFNFIKNLNRTVLSDASIKKYNKKGLLIEGPIKENALQPNSIDVTLSPFIKRLDYENGEIIDVKKEIKYTDSVFEDSIIIDPHEFVLMSTNEIFNIPNGILAFICGRSSIARVGIQCEQAGLIDSGFRGTITLEIQNQSNNPIRLYRNMRIAQVYFFKAEYANIIYGLEKFSKYNGQVEATGSRIHLDKELQ